MHNVAFEISTFPSLQVEVLDRIGGSWEVARISAAFDFASTHHKAPPLLIRELPTKNFKRLFCFWTGPCAGFFIRGSFLLAVMFNAAHQASHQTVKLLFLQGVKL